VNTGSCVYCLRRLGIFTCSLCSSSAEFVRLVDDESRCLYWSVFGGANVLYDFLVCVICRLSHIGRTHMDVTLFKGCLGTCEPQNIS
jgi:hypothetical protein